MKDKLNLTLIILFMIALIFGTAMFGYYFGFKRGYQTIKFAVDNNTPGVNAEATKNNDSAKKDNSNNTQANTGETSYEDKALGIKFSYPTNISVQKKSKGVVLEFKDKQISNRNSEDKNAKINANASIDIYESVSAFTGGYNDLQTYISYLGSAVDKYKKSQLGANFWEEYDELGEGYTHNYVLEKKGKTINVSIDDQSYEVAKENLEKVLEKLEISE